MTSNAQIDVLSVVARQCIAVTCLERFCKRYDIAHPAISMFVEHVWKVAQIRAETFPSWERTFSHLPVTGLGDKWPKDVCTAIPECVLGVLPELVEHVLETSACTWYGDDLLATKRQLEIVLKICQKHGVLIPDFENYTQQQAQLHGGWGPSLTDQEVRDWRALV
jgi:hypothetical protein